MICWGRKLNIFVVSINKYYFAVPKNIKLNSTHYFIMKIQSQMIEDAKFTHSLLGKALEQQT